MTPEKSGQTDEFYVGYAPPMPPRLARFIKKTVVFGSVGVVVAGAVVALGHRRLEGGSFAFGERHPLTGVIAEHPYPTLHMDSGNDAASHAILLVAPGKHGAAGLLQGLDRQRVSMEGARIQRDGRTMIEVVPESIAAASAADNEPQLSATALGNQAERVTLRGEVVDTKCFLGVMVPGAGKTHRECASLCLRGGIPPALWTRDRDGQSTLVLLETQDGDAIPTEHLAQLAGTHIEITGLRGQRGGWPTLQSDPATWTRLRLAAR